MLKCSFHRFKQCSTALLSLLAAGFFFSFVWHSVRIACLSGLFYYAGSTALQSLLAAGIFFLFFATQESDFLKKKILLSK